MYDQFKNILLLFSLTTLLLECQESGGWRSWLEKGKNYFMGQKKIMSQSVKAALRKPSFLGAIAGGLAAVYLRQPKAKAETIFVAHDKQGNMRDLTPEEHEKAYQAKLSSQFPTARCYEAYDPNANETKVIQQKINEALPGKNIEALFVPDTVYTAKALELMQNKRIEITPKDINEENTCAINLSPKIKEADLITNNALVQQVADVLGLHKKKSFWETIKTYGQPQKIASLIKPDHWHQIANNIIREYTTTYKPPQEGITYKKYTEIKKFDLDLKNNRDLINAAIDADIKAYEENQSLLWRGLTFTRVKEFNLQDMDPALQYQQFKKSLSYGLYLFGGCLEDKDACAYEYMKPRYLREGIGYAVPIPKTTTIEDAVYIPPLNAMSSLLSTGEWFHPRLKWSTKKIPSYGEAIPSSVRMQGTKEQKQQKVTNFLKHIYKHAIPLTPATEKIIPPQSFQPLKREE